VADTGLPWELPYPLPTDLVRDGADAIKDLAEAVADGLDAAGNPGIGPNVVQTVKTNTFTTTGTSFVDVTGLAVTITPTSATSRILVIVSMQWGSGGLSPKSRLIGGDLATTWPHDFLTRIGSQGASFNFGAQMIGTGWAIVDSPASTSAQTYQVQANGNGGTFTVNQSVNGDDTGASSIMAIEVAP
jgi:hypothetical protein